MSQQAGLELIRGNTIKKFKCCAYLNHLLSGRVNAVLIRSNAYFECITSSVDKGKNL